MLETLLVFCLGLAPPLLSLWLVRHAQTRVRQRLQAAREVSARQFQGRIPESMEGHRVGVAPSTLGDKSCRFNARSAYIRCAVNPTGPCEGCRHYERLPWA